MSTYAAVAHTTYVAGYDMTGDTNNTTLSLPYDALDNTRFRSGTGVRGRTRQAGLQDVSSSVNGFWTDDEDAIDETAWAALGGPTQVVTQSVTGSDGDRAYFYQAGVFEYSLFGNVGELIPFSLNLQGARGNGSMAAGAVPGTLLVAKAEVDATGATGAEVELGEVAAGQYLYASFHVFARDTTITAVLESDEDDTFGGATTRATFGPLTATGGTWAARVAGPITDTWYRIRVSAITGSHTIAAAAGIK
ncbi:hypothetical protein ABGB07_03895 [Micromonosporaceae bacterium B7E4]